MVVVFPAPLGPSRPKDSARPRLEPDAIHGMDQSAPQVSKRLPQVLNLNHARFSHLETAPHKHTTYTATVDHSPAIC